MPRSPASSSPTCAGRTVIVLPNTDSSDVSKIKAKWGYPITEWPLENRSTQQQVNDAYNNGTPNRASVPGLENKAGFTETKPTTTISNYPTDEVASSHRTLTYQCPHSNQPDCGPGPTAR